MLDDQSLATHETPVQRQARDCAVEDWLGFLGHRWNACLIWHLSTGTKTFGELAGMLEGVSAKVLTERLAGLEQRNLITRDVAAKFPRTVSYTLTGKGEQVLTIIRQIEHLT